jgi:hypothetical protein
MKKYGPATMRDTFCLNHEVELPNGEIAEVKGVLGNLLSHPEPIPLFEGVLPENGFTAKKAIRRDMLQVAKKHLKGRYLGYVKGMAAKWGYALASHTDTIGMFGRMIGLDNETILKNIPKLREYGSFALKLCFARRFRVLVVGGEDRWGADGHFRLVNPHRIEEFDEAVSMAYNLPIDQAIKMTTSSGHQIAAMFDSQGRPFFGKGVLEIAPRSEVTAWKKDVGAGRDIDIIAYPGSVKFAEPGVYDVYVYYRNIKRYTDGVKVSPQLVRLNLTKASLARVREHFEGYFHSVTDYENAMEILNMKPEDPAAPELDSGVLNGAEILGCGIGQWPTQISPLLKACVTRSRKIKGFSSYTTIGSYVTGGKVKHLAKGECTLSKAIAKRYGLRVGDTISLFASPATDSACGFPAKVVCLNGTLGIGISIADAKGAKRDWDGDSIFCALGLKILPGIDSVPKTDKNGVNNTSDPDWPLIALLEPVFYQATDTPVADTWLRNVLSLLKDKHPAAKELVLKHMGAPLQRSVDFKHPQVGGALNLSAAIASLKRALGPLNKEADLILKVILKVIRVKEWLESEGQFDTADRYDVHKAVKKIFPRKTAEQREEIMKLFPHSSLSNPLASLFTMRPVGCSSEDDDEGFIGADDSIEKALRFLGNCRFSDPEKNPGWYHRVLAATRREDASTVSSFFKAALDPASRLVVNWKAPKQLTTITDPTVLKEWKLHLRSYLRNVMGVEPDRINEAIRKINTTLNRILVVHNQRRTDMRLIAHPKLRSIRFVAIQNLIRLEGMKLMALFPNRDEHILNGLKKLILVGFAQKAIDGVRGKVTFWSDKKGEFVTIITKIRYHLQSVPYLFPEVARCLRAVLRPYWPLSYNISYNKPEGGQPTPPATPTPPTNDKDSSGRVKMEVKTQHENLEPSPVKDRKKGSATVPKGRVAIPAEEANILAYVDHNGERCIIFSYLDLVYHLTDEVMDSIAMDEPNVFKALGSDRKCQIDFTDEGDGEYWLELKGNKPGHTSVITFRGMIYGLEIAAYDDGKFQTGVVFTGDWRAAVDKAVEDWELFTSDLLYPIEQTLLPFPCVLDLAEKERNAIAEAGKRIKSKCIDLLVNITDLPNLQGIDFQLIKTLAGMVRI